MRLSILGSFLLLASCAQENKPAVLTPAPVPPPVVASAPTSNTGANVTASPQHIPTEVELLKIAETYTAWGRVDESPGFAPVDCRAPSEKASQVRMSAAQAEHEQKLYFLFAKNKDQYLNLPTQKSIDHKNQIVVKESWTSKEVKTDHRKGFSFKIGEVPSPITQTIPKDGVAYETDQPAPLFIMFYAGVGETATDNGWWYATISPDKKTVTSSGIISSCQGCHTKAQYKGLFGLRDQ